MLGIQRLNAKKTQPNLRIIFIKPLKGKDEAIAQDFLERIAAQCRMQPPLLTFPSPPYSLLLPLHLACGKLTQQHNRLRWKPPVPIMKEHHLSVTTLEEYEPNREFVGRNFNGGEIIQLVLKAPGSGHWLPFNYVQMVMMHELAHCVQMNHSRAFWKVRNLYAEQMRTLWARRYTGEGMWGRGALLGSGEFENNAMAEGEDLPEHLCGGTYRSRRRKRKGKGGVAELSYQEKKQRRIEKKFGKNGVSLGADDDVKAKLEKGKRTQAAPRVAGSNRGRELRAAAALARFEEKKPEPEEQEEGEEGSDESDYEDAEDADLGADDALDINGKKLRDPKGNRMVKVCEDENPNDEDAANELQELQSSITIFFSPRNPEDTKAITGSGSASVASHSNTAQTRARNASPRVSDNTVFGESHVGGQVGPSSSMTKNTPKSLDPDERRPPPAKVLPALHPPPKPGNKSPSCPVCSFENEAIAVTCSMCSNVLDPDSVPGTWSCQSASCQGGVFLNAGDCGTCGVCGQRKSAGSLDG